VIANDESYTIAGVVRDSHYTSPASIDPVFHVAPSLSSTSVIFRTDIPDAAARVRAIVEAVEPALQLRIQPLTANVDDAVRYRRTAANLAWAIGVLGLALATVGVFGVFAYAVEERRREIGLRVALGARAGDVLRTLLVANQWPVGGGLAAGLMLSAGAGIVLRSYLFGLSPLDPQAYLFVGVLMGLAATVATVVPARRALRVDPSVSLKSE
jgi:ABC-type lipoprotein release transport system permease subunit